jgi:hypothetical protein
MKDYKFVIGLRLYLITINYSILVGYIYGNYKNYNVTESVIIAAIVGILAPFFIPFHYIIEEYYKKPPSVIIYNPEIQTSIYLDFKDLYTKNSKIRPIKNRV